VTSAARAQASLMHKRQRRRESEGVMSSPLIMHRIQVLVSRGDSVITSLAARGAALAINSTFVIEGGKHRNTVEL
jgi:anti-sigma factor RsiW